MKVLCVMQDGSELARTIVAMRELGHEAVWARSSSEADARLAADLPDVVMLDCDIALPDLVALIRRLREMCGSRYAYVMLLTGTGANAESILHAAYEAGCDGDFRKGCGAAQWKPRLQAASRILALPTPGVTTETAAPARRSHESAAAAVAVPVPASSKVAAAPSPLDTIAQSSTWQNLTSELVAVASGFLTVPIVSGPADTQMQGLGLATGIVLANVEQQTEIRIALATDKKSAGNLAVHLFGEDTLDLESDMLNELANMSMGALKTAFGRDEIRFTGGLPEALGVESFYAFGATCQRHETFVMNIQGARILVRVGIALKRNQVVSSAGLCEGMVLAKDLFNAQGMLMLRLGTRLSSTTADRLRSTLGPKQMIEVAMGAA